jgi:hypothetical protein
MLILQKIIISDLPSHDIRIGCICSIEVLHFFLISVERFTAFGDRLWFLSGLDPAFLFTMLLLATVMIVRVLFALAFSPFIRISSILSQFFNSFELLLLPSQLFLLLFHLPLPFLFFLEIIFPLLLD